MMDVALYLSLALVAITGTATVLTREPVRQSIVSSAFGAVMAVTFLLLAAPGVAMAVIVVDVVAIPVLVVVTMANIRRNEE